MSETSTQKNDRDTLQPVPPSTKESSSSEPGQALDRAKDRLAEQGSQAMEEVRELGKTAVEEGEAVLRSAQELGSSAMEDLREQADNTQANLENYVRENPLRSLAYAAGAGLALSLLLRR